MKNALFFSALAVLSLALCPLASEAASVKAVRVVGQVELVNPVGQRSVLSPGSEFGQGHSVVTGARSSAVLYLPNGSVVNVAANSSLAVSELLQDPYDPSLGSYDTLRADPSRSSTRLQLNYGEVVGQVKSLRSDSRFEIATEVGVAGIRGTIVKVTFGVDSEGKKVMTVVNADGVVLVQSMNVDGLTEFQAIPPGTEATIMVDDVAGTVSYSNLTASQIRAIINVLPPETVVTPVEDLIFDTGPSILTDSQIVPVSPSEN